MNEAKQIEVQKWLIKSQHDLGSARRLMAGDKPYLDTAVYHCQQAAEKALKAYILGLLPVEVQPQKGDRL